MTALCLLVMWFIAVSFCVLWAHFMFPGSTDPSTIGSIARVFKFPGVGFLSVQTFFVDSCSDHILGSIWIATITSHAAPSQVGVL